MGCYTGICKFPWLYAKSCLWFLPDVGKFPHHLNRSQAGLALSLWKSLTLEFMKLCTRFPFYPCFIAYPAFPCLVHVLSSWKQLWFTLISSRKLKQTHCLALSSLQTSSLPDFPEDTVFRLVCAKTEREALKQREISPHPHFSVAIWAGLNPQQVEN